MDVKIKSLGKVAVDSGRLRVGDPCYVDDRPDLCVEIEAGSGDGMFETCELTVAGVRYFAVNLDSTPGAQALADWKADIERRRESPTN